MCTREESLPIHPQEFLVHSPCWLSCEFTVSLQAVPELKKGLGNRVFANGTAVFVGFF